MSLHEKPEDRYDTLIGVILAFAMAIGVYLYSIKPKTASSLPLQNVVQTENYSVASQRTAPVNLSERNPSIVTPQVPITIEAAVNTPSTGAATTIMPAPVAQGVAIAAAEVLSAVPMSPPAEAVPIAPVQEPSPVVTTVPEAVPVTVTTVPVVITPAPEVPVMTTPVVVTAVPEVTAESIVPTQVLVTPTATPIVTPVAEAVLVTVEPASPATVVAPVLAPNVVIRETFQFAMGSARIPETAKPKLLEGVALLKNDTRKLKIVGHTDNIGFTGANRRLSLRRAKAVRAFLVNAGLNAELLSVEGVGESQPIGDNLTEEGRYQNRRIDIIEE